MNKQELVRALYVTWRMAFDGVDAPRAHAEVDAWERADYTSLSLEHRQRMLKIEEMVNK